MKQKHGLNSKIRCMTAGSSGVGRSDTFDYLHVSEYAFWPGNKEMTLKGLIQAVPNTSKSIIIIESTANGYEAFKDMWDKAVANEIDFIAVFVAWFELEEYRMEYNGFELTIEEKKLKNQYKLDNEQISWRRWCIKNNCNNDIDTFKQEYPSTPEEAFLMTGNCVFNKENVQGRLNAIRKLKPIKIGYFIYDIVTNEYGTYELDNIKWVNSKYGYIKLYELPKVGYPYVLSGDTAGTGEDYFTGQLINNITKKQVAVLRKKDMTEDKYAEQMACLGYMYNDALIGIETNYSTYPQERVVQLNYPNIYMSQKLTGTEKKIIKEFGFKTTQVTRPYIIAELVKLIEENVELINDIDTLLEMLVFIKNSLGRAEALPGKHDDLIMSLAIGYHICVQQVTTIKLQETKERELPEALKTVEQNSNFWY